MSAVSTTRPTAARKIVPGRASASHSLKALALYASIIGRQAGVEIVFGSYPTAATDGKKIYLPSLVNVAEAKWIVILRALIDHEVMHVRQTKFETIEDCNSPLSKILSNILEDCWGEREQAKVYPGSLKAIRAGMDELVALHWFSAPPADTARIDPRGAFVNWLLHELRGRHFVMPELRAWGEQWRALAEPAFGDQLLDEVLAIMYEVDVCRSSAQAVEISNRVVNLLRQQQQQLQQQAQQQRQEPQQPDQADQGDQGERGQPSSPQAEQAGQSEQAEQGQQADSTDDAQRSPDNGDSEGQDGSSGPDAAEDGDGETGGEGDGEVDGQDGADADGAGTGIGANSDRANGDEGDGAQPGQGAGGADSTDAIGGAGEGGSDAPSDQAQGNQPGGRSDDADAGEAAKGKGQEQSNGSAQGEAQPSATQDEGSEQGEPAASGDRTGGTQGSNTSAASGAVSSEGPGSQEGAGVGAGSGWIETPEELEEQARQIGEALAAELSDLPATELADAICAKLEDAGIMKPGSPGTGDTKHAGLLSNQTWELPSSAERHDGGAEQLEARSLAAAIERRLGAKLRDMLEARIQSSSTYSRRGLRVGAQRLSRAKSGSLEVFRKTEEGDELSTALSLLVDMSGSMADPFGNTTRCIGAAAAAYAVAETLGKFAVPFAWINFGSSASAVKRFEEPWRKRRGGAVVQSLGGTTLDVPLLRLAPELAARDEERKLLLVITDGEPSDLDAVVAVLSLMPMMGVEVAMLFIGHDGTELEQRLAVQGIQVARSHRPEELTLGLFQAVENAFI